MPRSSQETATGIKKVVAEANIKNLLQQPVTANHIYALLEHLWVIIVSTCESLLWALVSHYCEHLWVIIVSTCESLLWALVSHYREHMWVIIVSTCESLLWAHVRQFLWAFVSHFLWAFEMSSDNFQFGILFILWKRQECTNDDDYKRMKIR